MPLRDQSTRVITSHLPDCDMDTGAIAQLRTVDIGRLHKGNEEEAANLFRAAKEDGVFYLDLQDQSFLDIIDRVDDVFAVSKDLFSLRQSEKNEYDIDRLGSLKMNG